MGFGQVTNCYKSCLVLNFFLLLPRRWFLKHTIAIKAFSVVSFFPIKDFCECVFGLKISQIGMVPLSCVCWIYALHPLLKLRSLWVYCDTGKMKMMLLLQKDWQSSIYLCVSGAHMRKYECVLIYRAGKMHL